MADAAPNKPFLRHKKTGDVYVYNSILAKRDDMEQTDEGPTAPPAQPARIMTAAAAATVAPSPNTELASLRARIEALELEFAGFKAKGDTVSPSSAPAPETPPTRRRRRSAAAAPAAVDTAQLDLEDATAANVAAMEELMQRANSAAGRE
ncbi:MAG: hypothetical protein WAS51_14495 [Ilumatobacteraceae bacterium]